MSVLCSVCDYGFNILKMFLVNFSPNKFFTFLQKGSERVTNFSKIGNKFA